MTLPIFPGPDLLRGLTYSSKWEPRFFNQNAVSPTGAEYDIAVAEYPLHDFELNYRFLRDGPRWGDALSALEFRTMMGFYLAMRGQAGRFLYRNPDDYTVARNLIGMGDGATRAFTITRSFGANGYAASEPVGQVDTGELFNVYLGSSFTPANPADYVLDVSKPVANTITFDTAPTNGTAVYVDMNYFYYCKLASNTPSFEKFMTRLWSIGQLQIRSCRPGT